MGSNTKKLVAEENEVKLVTRQFALSADPLRHSCSRLRADTRWVRELMVMADSEVRGSTGHAVSAVNDTALDVASAAAAGRKALSALPGFVRGDALASAPLTAAAPDRMAVYDRRAQTGLEMLGLPLSAARGRYGRYMNIVFGLASEAERRGHPWSPRQVDLALFALGGQKKIS
ncbi:hypothetical protein NicSoilC5_08960 [Arthrobacter sp. NicSoilC5]|nr:hypothetical protein NicSoilC5_08960 [Arthrobacter sp. NicSoilC5]